MAGRSDAMGEIVAAIFTTHVPRLMILDPAARAAYMGRNVSTFYDAMAELERERLRELAFDTFAVVDTHWFTTLEYVLNAHERLQGLYTSEELPQMLHELAYDYLGDPLLAVAMADAARHAGLRAIASAHPGLPLHYPTLNVMHYFNPDRARRVLAMGVCQTASTDNDLRFGAAIRSAIRASDHRAVLGAADDYRARCSPEGRFSHYLIMAGALGGPAWNWRGRQFGRYEAAIGTGQAIFYFDADGGAERGGVA